MKEKSAVILACLLVYVFSTTGHAQTKSDRPKWAGPLFLFSSTINGKYGYIDLHGRVRIRPQFDDAGEFSEGLATVAINGKYGYVDTSGKMVIDPRFDSADAFSAGLARIGESTDVVHNVQKFGYINKTGQVVIKTQFDSAESFSEGLAAVKINGKYGYVNPSGQFVIESQFLSGRSFSDGLALVRILSGAGAPECGYISKSGAMVIKIAGPCDHAESFSEGLAPKEIDGMYGYMNTSGKVVIKPGFKLARGFSDGLARIAEADSGTKKFGYINKRGKVVIKPQFDNSAGDFSEGLASVVISGRQVYIDKTGTVVINIPFTRREPLSKFTKIRLKALGVFSGGLTLALRAINKVRGDRSSVVERADYAYVNRKGKIVSGWSTFVESTSPACMKCDPIPEGPPRLISINIDSAPAGAIVYLIPRIDWDFDRDLKKLEQDIARKEPKLSNYILPETNTPITTKVYEQVYKVLFELRGNRQLRQLDVTKDGSNQVKVEFQ